MNVIASHQETHLVCVTFVSTPFFFLFPPPLPVPPFCLAVTANDMPLLEFAHRKRLPAHHSIARLVLLTIASTTMRDTASRFVGAIHTLIWLPRQISSVSRPRCAHQSRIRLSA